MSFKVEIPLGEVILEETNKIFKVTKQSRLWTEKKDEQLIKIVSSYEDMKNVKWKSVSSFLNKTSQQCYSRYRQINPSLNKGIWSREEEKKLLELVAIHGQQWAFISKHLKTRSGKQIRHHYINILDVRNNKQPFSKKEDALLKQLYLKHGPKWVLLSKYFKGRTADLLKSRFYNKMKNTIEIDRTHGELNKNKSINLKQKVSISSKLNKWNYQENNTHKQTQTNDKIYSPSTEQLNDQFNNINNYQYGNGNKCNIHHLINQFNSKLFFNKNTSQFSHQLNQGNFLQMGCNSPNFITTTSNNFNNNSSFLKSTSKSSLPSFPSIPSNANNDFQVKEMILKSVDGMGFANKSRSKSFSNNTSILY